MVKLKVLFDESFENSDSLLTKLSNLFSDVDH